MTKETKHTPTPWVHKDGEVYEENDFKIFDAYNSDFLYEEDKANAAHIVKCVNMHDELVEAVQDLICAGEFRRGCEDLKAARETLKKAGAL